MNGTVKSAILASLAFVMTGCPPSTMPLKDALQSVQNELVDTHIVNMAQLINETIDNSNLTKPGQVTKSIRAAQCSYQTDNPLLPILTKDVSLALQGTFTTGGNAGGGGLGAVPTATIGVNVSDSKSLGITIPITFTYLEDLPFVYIQTRASYFTGISDENIKARFNGAEVARISDQLKVKVNQLRSSYQKYKEAEKKNCKGIKNGEGDTIEPIHTVQ